MAAPVFPSWNVGIFRSGIGAANVSSGGSSHRCSYEGNDDARPIRCRPALWRRWYCIDDRRSISSLPRLQAKTSNAEMMSATHAAGMSVDVPRCSAQRRTTCSDITSLRSAMDCTVSSTRRHGGAPATGGRCALLGRGTPPVACETVTCTEFSRQKRSKSSLRKCG